MGWCPSFLYPGIQITAYSSNRPVGQEADAVCGWSGAVQMLVGCLLSKAGNRTARVRVGSGEFALDLYLFLE